MQVRQQDMSRGESSDPGVILSFLHTNDTHGHLAQFRTLEHPEPVGGVARRATLVRRIRQEAAHVLLVDAGDVHQGCLMADAFQGAPDIELMNELGYVAMGLGNHDVEYGWETFLQRKEAARFPILCANLRYADSGQPVLKTHALVRKGDVTVAFTSFAGPDWQYIVESEKLPGMRIADPIETARRLIPELRAQADLVVVLGHQYLQDDYDLVNAVPGIDIVIGAHEHAKMATATRVGGALVVEAYQWGAYLGRLDVTVSAGKIVDYAYDLIPLTVEIPADPAIEARVGRLQAELRQLYPERFEQVGQAAIDISNENIRSQATPLGGLVCDVMRRTADADVAIMPALTVLNALFAGPLLVQDIHDALPYPNRIWTFRLIGEQVKQVLEQSAARNGTGSFMQVSGVRFRTIDGTPTDITIDGRPLDPRRTYTIATTEYQVKRSTEYRGLFAAARDLSQQGVTVKQALCAHIRACTPLEAPTVEVSDISETGRSKRKETKGKRENRTAAGARKRRLATAALLWLSRHV
jgi:2',3'-cyclic-nucleotide 2'-phosphodiesterase (5'-nucleotidase family)